ncbi:FACT complex subunit SSRP1 [Oopsacas minuta]|uniref:FACT complex subunit SSRP1 n=1 Tax=Oopsacas minuta TaxID=111878 RepID=A0AAV7JHP8_9METZ|nr:FACT complex subunit SSRP1 [Oopsacas minuta]
MFIVKCLDPPIRHGQTRYNFVIQKYTKEDMCEITLHISQEDLETKFQDRLSRTMTGPTYEVYARILKELVGRKITISKNYKTRNGAHAISCALRANPGLLYPLEKAFLFIHKPPVLVRFDEVACVNFARVLGGSTIKSFDFEVENRNGTSYTFSNIAREDYPSLSEFVTQKKLAVKNKGQRNIRDTINEGMDDSDNEPDHYLEQMKLEGEMKDSEDEDSSYAAESEKDDDLEFDSQASISDSENEANANTEEQRAEPKPKKIERSRKESKSNSKSKKKEKTEKSSKVSLVFYTTVCIFVSLKSWL